MNTVDVELLRARVSYFTFGLRPSIQASLVAELTRMIDQFCEDARRQVLDELADIVVALEIAAEIPEGENNGSVRPSGRPDHYGAVQLPARW